ncbi:MAG: amidohydrolase [Acidobacteriota bacterium]|nr:MAG: amidohydrolase [Acidobacteriota bacterium]
MFRKFAVVLMMTACAVVSAQAKDMSAEIDAAAQKILPKVIEWRRHLHKYPELGNREVKTAKFIETELRRLGIEVKTGIAVTGVVGIIRGGQPGPVIALRADMDGLPVTERADLPYRSVEKGVYNGQTVGVMHACGHDTHVAMLLGAANVLVGMKDKIKGTVILVFQPAEEGPPAGEEGGAYLMVKEGVLENPKVEAIFGIHISAGMPIGRIAYKSGAAMASSDWFTIKIKGQQTHGAYPWMGNDPIAVATQIYTGLQMIVSRRTNLTASPAVITVGRISGGVRENIIPEEVTMAGTIRALDRDIQRDIHEKMRLTVAKIAESVGTTAELTIFNAAPITYNEPGLTRRMVPSLEKAAGKDRVFEANWVTGAEDFAFFQEKVPGMYFWVGGMAPGTDPAKTAHHTPDFVVDDSRLDVGVKAFCNIVFDYPAK